MAGNSAFHASDIREIPLTHGFIFRSRSTPDPERSQRNFGEGRSLLVPQQDIKYVAEFVVSPEILIPDVQWCTQRVIGNFWPT